MGLEDLAIRLHLRKAPNEILRIAIQPKSTIHAASTHSGEEITNFNAFLLELEKAIAEVYDVNFTRTSETRGINETYQGATRSRTRSIRNTYLLADKKTSIEYLLKVSGVSGECYGYLTIMQKSIDLKKAGRLLRGLLEVGVLAIDSNDENNSDFSIFHYRGPQVMERGKELLASLGLPFPNIGCRYYCEPGVIGWLYIRTTSTHPPLRVVARS